MTPGEQIQRLLADVPGYESVDTVTLLPYVAALQSALHARMLAFQYQITLPDTDNLLKTGQLAQRPRTTVKWVRENLELLRCRCENG